MALVEVGAGPVRGQIEGVNKIGLETGGGRIHRVSIGVRDSQVQRTVIMPQGELHRMVDGTGNVFDPGDIAKPLIWTQHIQRKIDAVESRRRRSAIASGDQSQHGGGVISVVQQRPVSKREIAVWVIRISKGNLVRSTERAGKRLV